MTRAYPKTFQSASSLVALLQERGLIINDISKAQSYLSSIGYFRLSAYCYPFLEIPKENHRYKPNSHFEKVLDLYRFDKKLRLLVFNEVEKIEVAIRSVMVNAACQQLNDAFWITQRKYFSNAVFFDRSISDINSELSRSKEDFVVHFKSNYSDDYPPAWMLIEILSLGSICKIYKNIKDLALKKKIARHFGLHFAVFESWIMTIAGLRNICCHHGRLWNRVLLLRTTLPQKTAFPWLQDAARIDVQRVYFRLCMIQYLLFSISPNNTFKEKLVNLLNSYPNVDISAMGFPSDWQEESLWN
ncbi:MAG: Abi family protein [Mangrovibacterium sp.]